MTNIVEVQDIFRIVHIQDGENSVDIQCPFATIEVQNLGAIGQQGPQGDVGPAPTGTRLDALTEISSLANDDLLLIFDASEEATRQVRLDDLKVFFNS